MHHQKRVDEASTNGSETPPQSPIPRKHTNPLYHSMTFKGSLFHIVQCDCDLRFGFLSKSIRFWDRSPKKESCSTARKWVARCKPHQATETYESLLQIEIDCREHKENLHQIEIDLNRTYPNEPYFSDSGAGKEALRRILTAFSNYDPALGYVQGMNFITAALLWHATEVDAFWLLVHLMEDYDLRDNYIPNLPGLSKHCQIVNLLIFERLPRLHMQFCTYRIASEMFITDWCLSMFGSLAPVQDMGVLITAFLKSGWIIFYKIVLVILRRLEDTLLSSSDISDIITSLRPPSKSQHHWREFVSHLQKEHESLNWRSLFTEAESIHINNGYIQKLHFDFNLDTSRFSTT